MSGAEAATAPTFDWAVSLGSILSLIVASSVVIVAVANLVRYLKKNVTREVVQTRQEMNSQMNNLLNKLEVEERGLERRIDDGLKVANQRTDELRYWVEKINEKIQQNIENRDRLIQQVKQDATDYNIRLDDELNDLKKQFFELSGLEIQQLVKRLDSLREEQHRLALEQARRRMDNDNKNNNDDNKQS